MRVGAVGMSAILSACVWGMSSTLTGQVEPWDAGWPYYSGGIIVASFVGSLLAGRRVWLPMLGAYVGQVLYCWIAYHPGGPIIFPIAISVAIFGIIPSLIGALLGAVPGETFHRWRMPPSATTTTNA